MSDESNWQELFQKAIDHRNEHDCSAYPYENGDRLIEIVRKFKPRKVLEIGTGIGYTAAIIALSAPEAHVETIEKNLEHATLARKFLVESGVGDRVYVIQESAEEFLTTLQPGYDLIFFDGFQIHYEFLPHYTRLLKPQGILFLANNHLKSRTSDKFFEELQTSNNWKILEQFDDTTIAQRL